MQGKEYGGDWEQARDGEPSLPPIAATRFPPSHSRGRVCIPSIHLLDLHPLQLTVHRGKGLLETAAAGGEGDAWLAAGAAGVPRSFEDAVDASGLLRDAPPGEIGESGHSFYTVQVSSTREGWWWWWGSCCRALWQSTVQQRAQLLHRAG